MLRFAAYDLVLHCLPMSHKKDARLIWVKVKTSQSKLKSDEHCEYKPCLVNINLENF